MLKYNQFITEGITDKQEIKPFDLLIYRNTNTWTNQTTETYHLVLFKHPTSSRIYVITNQFETRNNIGNIYTGYGSNGYDIVNKPYNEKQQREYDELMRIYHSKERYFNVKEGDYVILKELKSSLNGKVAKVITYNNGMKDGNEDKNSNSLSVFCYGVTIPSVNSNLNKLGGKLRTNSGLNIQFNHIESFIDPTDKKVLDLEKKLAKIDAITPNVGDYILCKNYLPGTRREIPAKDLVAKVAFIDGYRVVAKLSEPSILKEGKKSYHLIDLTFNNISKILPNDSARVQRYLEQEKEYNEKLPRVGNYILLKGRVSNFDIPADDNIIVEVVDLQINNRYGADVISHIGVKLSRPTNRFGLSNLGGKLKAPIGMYIDFANIKEIIRPEPGKMITDERIIAFMDEEKTYMERIPSLGDFVEIDVLYNKIGQVVANVNNDNHRIRLIEYHNPNEEQFTRRFRYDAVNQYYYADFKIGTLLKAKPEHPLIKLIISNAIEPMVISEKLKLILPKYLHKLYSDITYLDVGTGIDEITFLSVKKYKDIPEAERWTIKSRQSTKVGRLISKICGDILQKDVERMVNDYKASYKMEILGEFPFQVVEGEDIRYWYLEERYQKPGGTLNNSCMRYAGVHQQRLQFYVDNPDVCKLVIMKNGEGKLKGRALLWTLDDGRKFMDRVYTVDQYDENMFWKYADFNKYLKRIDLSGYGGKHSYRLSVNVKKGDYNLPYLDTLKSYDKMRGTLRNY